MKPAQTNDKLDVILDAAQRRFGHYGLSKTTMNEIADDIGMSKASLYYYFKDKESIFKAVAEKEQLFFEGEMSKVMKESRRAASMLSDYVELRLNLLKKLLTLGKFSYRNYMELKPILNSVFQEFKKREIAMIAEIIMTGVDSKEFSLKNVKTSAELFVDALRGLRQVAVLGSINETNVVSASEYQKLRRQSLMFTELFIRGIAANKK